MKTVRTMFALFGALSVLALLAVPAGAGGVVTMPNTVTIKKVVVGPVPAGTTFTVHVTCSTGGGVSPSAAVAFDVIFDATGTATSGNDVIEPGPSGSCSVTETVTGGAKTVAYACATTGDRATCSPDNTQVSFNDVTNSTGTLTVTNTFPTPDPVPEVAPVVVVAPAFTG